ncbi:MAG TPA: hypothetical protein VFJ64_03100 [Solirubrobacterales bacterium]|nr:hypothetical protein [Solirubrobacterales bacterium]
MFESGTYEGNIEFHGEGGYSDVTATSVDGLVGPITNFFCVGGGPGETWGPRTYGARLRVRTTKQRNSSFLEVSKNHRRARVPFYAVMTERLGVISVRRTVEGSAGAGAFTFDPRLQTAALVLPAPFAGRAEYNRAATRGGQWAGNLSVDFPGRPNVRLTGSGARTELVHREIFR